MKVCVLMVVAMTWVVACDVADDHLVAWAALTIRFAGCMGLGMASSHLESYLLRKGREP